MRAQGVPNRALAMAGLTLMQQAGKPLSRLRSSGPAMIYETSEGTSVRLRTCNKHLLLLKADGDDPRTAHVKLEGTEFLLMIMPERERTPGPVIAYLVPTSIAAEAVRASHQAWLEAKPNTSGKNRTWTIWFGTDGPSSSNNFAEKWAEYRVPGSASAGTAAVG